MRNDFSTEMRRAVQAAQGAVGLVVAHYLIETNDLLKRLIDCTRGTRRRLVVGNNLKNCAHDVFLFVDERRCEFWIGCRDKCERDQYEPQESPGSAAASAALAGRPQRSRRDAGVTFIPAHRPHRSGLLRRSRRPRTPEPTGSRRLTRP